MCNLSERTRQDGQPDDVSSQVGIQRCSAIGGSAIPFESAPAIRETYRVQVIWAFRQEGKTECPIKRDLCNVPCANIVSNIPCKRKPLYAIYLIRWLEDQSEYEMDAGSVYWLVDHPPYHSKYQLKYRTVYRLEDEKIFKISCIITAADLDVNIYKVTLISQNEFLAIWMDELIIKVALSKRKITYVWKLHMFPPVALPVECLAVIGEIELRASVNVSG